jgi:hypothetical protein
VHAQILYAWMGSAGPPWIFLFLFFYLTYRGGHLTVSINHD